MTHPEVTLTPAGASSLVAAASWDTAKDGMFRVGIEFERLPIRIRNARQGPLTMRLPLEGADMSVTSILDAAAESGRLGFRRDDTSSPRYVDSAGGALTFEPGAQIEHSTPVHLTAAAAITDVQRTAHALDDVFGRHDVTLVPLGIDPWHPVAAVPQQLHSGRYVAMEEYLARRGPHGAVMMRHTASMQLNLDAPPTPLGTQRWRLANLLAPIWTAWFSTSPARGVHSTRAHTWRHVDPTRTGFPRRLGEAVPIAEIVTESALAADVLLVERAGRTLPGTPGFRFRDWLREGHPVWGPPTASDLAGHLTTLFPEVRLRNSVLELRSIDAPPMRWLPAVVTYVVGALYDERALDELLDLLTPRLAGIAELHRAATATGPTHPALAPVATEAMRLALEGAERLGATQFERSHLAGAAEFHNRYVEPTTTMAAELHTELRRSSRTAMAWATTATIPHRGGFS